MTGGDHLFRYMPPLLSGKEIPHIKRDAVDLPYRKLRVSNSTRLKIDFPCVSMMHRVPNCPSQKSISASLQCNCKAQCLDSLRVSVAEGSRRHYKDVRVREKPSLTQVGPNSTWVTPGWCAAPS